MQIDSQGNLWRQEMEKGGSTEDGRTSFYIAQWVWMVKLATIIPHTFFTCSKTFVMAIDDMYVRCMSWPIAGKYVYIIYFNVRVGIVLSVN